MARIKLRLLRFGLMIERITGEDAPSVTVVGGPHHSGGDDRGASRLDFELRRTGLNRPSCILQYVSVWVVLQCSNFTQRPIGENVRDHADGAVLAQRGCLASS
ncbi:MAG: hypothetical protein ACLPSF_13120 [Methylocella sp.]